MLIGSVLPQNMVDLIETSKGESDHESENIDECEPDFEGFHPSNSEDKETSGSEDLDECDCDFECFLPTDSED